MVGVELLAADGQLRAWRLRPVSAVSHWIDGQCVDGDRSRAGRIYDPATGKSTGTVPFAATGEVAAAVAAARAAFPGWRSTSLSRRVKVLFEFRHQLERRRDDLARVISAEHGKTVDDARGEIQRGVEVVEFACGIPALLQGAYSEDVSTGIDAYSIHQPLGVMAGITPFNFPAMVPMWMFPVAIACGNTFILKPSEKDPSASLILAEAWRDAGLPDGVFNVLHGDKAAVDALLDHPDVAAVSFVGSTPVARYVYQRGTASGKRIQALGGAKNHAVVLADADIDAAADAIVSAGYGSAGERCMAVSVVVAVDAIADELVAAIAIRAKALVIGPGRDVGVQMGPLVTGVHRDKVAGYVEIGKSEGAELVLDGRHLRVDGHPGGFYLGPCLFDRVSTDMTIYREEIFGPVLAVVRAAGFDEALAIVNANPYGNGVALFTSDGPAARRFQHDVEVGMVGINVPIPTPMAYYSFGGWKQSLFGDTHLHGRHGIHFCTRTKAVTARWPGSGAEAPAHLNFPTAQ